MLQFLMGFRLEEGRRFVSDLMPVTLPYSAL